MRFAILAALMLFAGTALFTVAESAEAHAPTWGCTGPPGATVDCYVDQSLIWAHCLYSHSLCTTP